MTGNLVNIWVGPKRKEFQAHGKLLSSCCKYWRRQVTLSPHYIGIKNGDPDIFSLFIDWLYRKTLPQISRNDEETAKAQVEQYVKLYLSAEEWGIADLKNLIIDTIRARKTCDMGWFPAGPIKHIYDRTESGSPLRRYIVDNFLFKSSRGKGAYIFYWSDSARGAELKEHLQVGNFDFVLDCYHGLYSSEFNFPSAHLNPIQNS